MRVSTLLLEDFRSYARTEISLAPGVTAFVGNNGAGKTNILEAIHLLARGDSPRVGEDAELVRWGAGMARVAASVERVDDARRVETLLFAPTAGERKRPRRYLLDGTPKRADDAVGEITVVAFFPEDVDLLADAPSARRRYLDAMVGQVDRRHRSETRQYQRVLEHRNALLRALRGDAPPPGLERPPASELAYWDEELCRLAATISLRRLTAVREIVPAFRAEALRFSGTEALDVAYASPAEGETADERAGSYRALLASKRDRELWQGTTLVGPHREDLAVRAHGRALPEFASRGEQRSAVLALKMAEAAWITERRGEAPVFLLDDVLSELDPRRRDALAETIPAGAQALVTAAFPAGIPIRMTADASLRLVRDGMIGDERQ
ncbi:MAG TPA: DNA replication/repair protein RecF [Candidatus Saccharimonadales bacterium]|nr:DNA replication/repair protein RecF [Candidatus Saccharimonadales bacterium]